MFVVPFVFAFYPELLLINEAVLDPRTPGGTGYLAGYDGQAHLVALLLLLARLVAALYLISSALAGYDRKPLSALEVVSRLGLAALLMFKPEMIWMTAALATLLLLIWHSRATNRSEASADAP